MNPLTWTCAGCGAQLTDPEHPSVWCPCCGAVGLWRRSHSRPVGVALAAGGRSWSAADVVSTAWRLRAFDAAEGVPWSAPCLVLLTGVAGSGKSTLALQLAAGLSPVLVVSAEESPGPALARRFVVAGMARRSDVTVVRQLDAAALAEQARQRGAIVIDSVTATWLQPEDLRALCDAGAALVIGTVQVTKDGSMAGPRALEHEADLVLRLDAGQFTVVKTRYGPAGVTGPIRGIEPAATTETLEVSP